MIELPQDESANNALLDAIAAPLVERAAGRPVVLVDGDGTLSPVDSSRIVLTRGGGDPAVVKSRFQALGYCFESFRFHTEVHLAIERATFEAICVDAAENAPLHPGAVEFLQRASRHALVVVSAGIPVVWRSILDRSGLLDVEVVGGIDHARPLVFGRSEKGRLARRFLAAGSRVLAIGDSDVDTEMLAIADEAVVVVNHRQNKDLLPHVATHRSLWQVVPQGQAHPGVSVRTFLDLHELVLPPNR